MRIVLYNFVQPDDPTQKQGGGVAIYQRNLIAALRGAGHEVISLSSGDRYTFFNSRPRLRSTSEGGLPRAYIINSPVFAPSHAAFYGISTYNENQQMDGLPADLRRRYGDVDVFHFQNIEGLTAGFFRALRSEFPDARILLSAHNYSFVCPQVNLWFREHLACEDYKDGRACVNCLLSADHHLFEPNARKINSVLDRLHVKSTSRLGRALHLGLRAVLYARRRLRGEPSPVREHAAHQRQRGIAILDQGRAGQYRDYRHTNIELASTVFDRILAVSARTKSVLVARGVPSERIAVSYIGTDHAEQFKFAVKRQTCELGLHIAYLGYMRADKGFFFLLDALFALPEDVASRIQITIAAPIRDQAMVERLRGAAHRFRGVRIFDGYTRDNLGTVLEGVNLGVVPVLWEDNLPQVAIEMVARGIPILTSDRGGAREIGDNEAFVFQAGSARDFRRRLADLAQGRVALSRFWEKPTRIFSMADHLDDLFAHYRGERDGLHRQPDEETAAPETALLHAAQ